jgi:hypothetical protein
MMPVRFSLGLVSWTPASLRRYLGGKFGADLKAVRSARQKLAKASRPQGLAHDACRPYEHFRPDTPEGKRGWGPQATSTWG